VSEFVIFRILLISSLIIALGTFLALLFISAPYGRHTRKGWGPLLPNWLGWFLMESVSVIAFLIMFIIGDGPKTTTTFIFLGMWELHYLQRAFVYPFVMRDGQKKMPLAIPLLASGFNLGNSYLNGRCLFHFAGDRYSANWLLDERFLIGAALFLTGFIINLWADHKLRRLRQPGETGYKVPHGGLYRYISCPNYFGEILEWTGWAIATWSLAGLTFAIWTFANLAPRALDNHRWYHENFESYPIERKALIPWVW
jgi:hypothetical protein